MSDPRTLVCMLVAVGLLAFIVVSGVWLGDLREIEAALVEAGNGGGGGDEALLAALAGLDGTKLSSGQARRRDERFIEIVERRLRSRPPLTSIGSQPFDAGRREPWRFSAGTHKVTVIATLDPPGLGRWVKTLTLGSAEPAAFAGSPPSAHVQVPLQGAGRQKEVTIAFGITTPGGDNLTITLPEPLVLHQDDRRPQIEARFNDGTALAGNEPISRVLSAGDGFSIEARDDVGLVLLAWNVDGREGEEKIASGPAVRSRPLPLPEGLTNCDQRRVADIEVRAENASGNRTVAKFRLDIRPKEWHPVRRLLVDGTPIERGKTQAVRGPRVRVLLEIEPGLLPEASDLALRVDGQEYRPAAAEGGLEAEIGLSRDKPSGILLLRGTSVLANWTVQADAEPPGVALLDAAGTALPPGKIAAPAGAVLHLEISDPNGVIESEQRIRPEGLERGRREVAPNRLVLAFTLPSRGEATLQVLACDRLGNETGELSWDITADEPVALSKILLDGRAPGGGRIPTRNEIAVLEIQGTPQGVVVASLFLGTEAPGALRSERLVLGADGARRAEISLVASTSPDRDRVVRLRDDRGRELAAFELRIDREPPALSVRKLAPAPGVAGAFEGRPGEKFEIAATDDDAVAGLEIADANGGEVQAIDGGLFRTARVPETLPVEIRARAVDAAGNEGILKFRILPPAPPNPPVPAPGPGVLQPVSAPNGLPVPASFREKLAAARAAGQGAAGAVEALKAIDALELAVGTLPAETDPRDLRAYREELALVREGLRGLAGIRPIPENLPATLTNPAGGQELVLVRPTLDGPEFRPFYIGKTEVTVGMFMNFLEARGKDAAFWAETLRGFRNPAGGSPDPEEQRAIAQRLSVVRLRRERPLVGATPEIAHVFLNWVGAGLKDPRGSVGIPTLREWQLAAGRAEHQKAVFPTTGAFPAGTDLRDRSCVGELGGAAIGGDPTRELPPVGSYAPGSFGLYDMAGSAWEWVLGPDDRPMAIGGGLPSSKEECKLDAPLRSVTPDRRGYVGIRIVIRY